MGSNRVAAQRRIRGVARLAPVDCPTRLIIDALVHGRGLAIEAAVGSRRLRMPSVEQVTGDQRLGAAHGTFLHPPWRG